jgi:hypothetical protein
MVYGSYPVFEVAEIPLLSEIVSHRVSQALPSPVALWMSRHRGEVGEYARGCGGALMHRGGSSNSTGNSGSSGVDCSAVRRAVPS